MRIHRCFGVRVGGLYILGRAGSLTGGVFAVTTARDGQEALEALQACDKVDLILTDLIMPQVWQLCSPSAQQMRPWH
jgi:CheY-like chemotaxis protein